MSKIPSDFDLIILREKHLLMAWLKALFVSSTSRSHLIMSLSLTFKLVLIDVNYQFNSERASYAEFQVAETSTLTLERSCFLFTQRSSA